MDLSVDLAPQRPGALVLRNPLLVASGTFGYGIEYGEVVDIDRLGAICCKGTTLKARVGNPPPRVTETPAGMLNSIGLQNPGVDAVLEKYAPRWATWEVPVIVNVAGESVEDYVAVARKLDEQPGVAGIELNISCPNVGKGGLQFALDARAAAEVTAAVRRATELPLLVKLSPAATDVRGIAMAIADAGADAICAVNTLSGMALDRHTRKPLLGNTYGGLSGPALKPVALRVVYEVAQVVDIPIVAIGGVSELDDVLDFLMAGACAVQVGHRRCSPIRCCRSASSTSWRRGARPRHGLPSRDRRRRAAGSPRAPQRQGRGVPPLGLAIGRRPTPRMSSTSQCWVWLHLPTSREDCAI